jgi:hypothetical protein
MAAAVMAARRIPAMRRDEIIASEAFKNEVACGCESFALSFATAREGLPDPAAQGIFAWRACSSRPTSSAGAWLSREHCPREPSAAFCDLFLFSHRSDLEHARFGISRRLLVFDRTGILSGRGGRDFGLALFLACFLAMGLPGTPSQLTGVINAASAP